MLRIVGGRLGGRRFEAPPGQGTRPTSERVREALASVLDARDALQGRQVLDLYAGSGGLAFEALSRGAEHAVLVEHDPRTVRVIERNVRALGLSGCTQVVREKLGTERAITALAAALPAPASLVFADPPYADIDAAVACLQALREAGLLAEDVRMVLEHATKKPPAIPGSFTEISGYRYGDTAARLWRRADEQP